MATGRLTVLENFLLRFNELKRRTRNDPERIPWLWKQSKQLRKIGEDVYTLHGDIERALARSPKLVGPVPPGFERAFKDYRERYAEKVLHAKFSIDTDKLLELIKASKAQTEDDQEESEERFPKYEVDEDGVTWITKQGESEKRFLIEEFYPEDDAYEKFVGVLEYARDRVESAKMGGIDDPGLMNLLSRGVGAWDFYRDPIGVDMEGIARRWKQVPHFFIPRHVLDRYGRSERGSLSHLLNDAIRAYVFGVPTAAIVMCRTVYEEFVKKHLGLEIQKNKKGYYPPLHKIIILAEKKFEWIGPLELGPKVEYVNGILHAYDRSTKITAADEKNILDYLTTVNTLMEKAP